MDFCLTHKYLNKKNLSGKNSRIKEMSTTDNPNQCKAKVLKVRTYISICLTVFAVFPFVSDTVQYT